MVDRMTPIGWLLPTIFTVLSAVLPHQLYDFYKDTKIAQAVKEKNYEKANQLKDSKLYVTDEVAELQERILKQIVGSDKAIDDLL